MTVAPGRALISGSTGFLGTALCQRLARDGWEVHAITRPTSRIQQSLSGARDVKLHQVAGWSELRESVRRVQPDVAIHLAALFRAEHSAEDISPLISANVEYGAQLVDALVASGCRALVTAGSTWQNFNGREGEPATLYAATKSAFEALVDYYVAADGLRAVSLQLSDMYGPGDDRPKLVPALLNAARTGASLALSPGEQKLDMLFIDDAVEAFVCAVAMLRDGTRKAKRSYRVSSGSMHSLRDVVAAAERAFGRTINTQWGARSYRRREVMTPWDGGEPLPDWTARWNLEDGLRAVADAADSVTTPVDARFVRGQTG